MTDKRYSKQFKRFAIEGEEFDFDAFETHEEFEAYKKELEEFIEMDDAEVMRVVMRYKNQE